MKTVLVIDDEQALVMALNLLLTAGGYRVTSAHTGEEGLLAASKEKPDLILLDVMMPGIGGLETLELLKAHPTLKDVPVVVMSPARPLHTPGGRPKWTEFLYKPFGSDDILSLVKRLA